MSKVGRPTVMNEMTIAKLDQGFAMGFSDLEACLYADISKDSLYRYCKENPEYSDRKETLKNHPKILAKTNIYNALKENKKVDDSKWYLERKNKTEFSLRTEMTGADGKELQVITGFNYIKPENKDGENSTDNTTTPKTKSSVD